MLTRPQPIGILPFPAGLLLLTPSTAPNAASAREALMRGGTPADWPPEWDFVARALEGDRDGALAALDASPGVADGVASYNRFVLSGDMDALAAARACGDADVRALAEVAAFVQGAVDTPPPAHELDGELAAVARLAQGAWRMERDEAEQGAATLALGVESARASSPLLAAQLQSQRAQLLPTAPLAIDAWRDALQLAEGSELPNLRADLALGLALALHESADAQRQRLVEAVNWYEEALRAGITIESRAETFALVQNNLGLAYISMPMTSAGDKIRLAVAVQSFREALKVYTREAYEAQWSSAMLNMANALQYLPSSHPKENLIEAVNAYEELLSVRNKALDPVGYARLLANQANALAHLGMFAPSIEKLTEARKLLSWHGEDDSAAALLEQVERINAQMTAGVAANGDSDDVPGEDALLGGE